MAAPVRTFIEIRGERLSLRQISERYQLPYNTVRLRYHVYGYEGEELIAPLRKEERFEVRGEQLTRSEIVAKYDLDMTTVWKRTDRGLTGEQLIAPTRDYTRADHETRALLQQIHEETGVSMATLRMRYQRGMRGEELRQDKLPVGRPPGRRNTPREPAPESVNNPNAHVEIHQFTNDKGELRFELRLVVDGMIKTIERSTLGSGYLSTGTAMNSASRLFKGCPVK